MTFSLDKWKGILTISLTIIVIGSVWGLAEMTLGGFLHAIHFPYKGAIMVGLAISFMAIFVTLFYALFTKVFPVVSVTEMERAQKET